MSDSLLTDAPATSEGSPGADTSTQAVPGASAPPPPAAASSSWIDALPEDLKGSPSLKRYKDPADLAKGYTELEKKLGQGFRIPSKDADPQEWDKFYREFGVPDSIDKYDITPPEDIPFDDENKERLLKQAHRMKLNSKQVNELLKAYEEDVKLGIQERKETYQQAESYLKDMYKANFPRNLAIAQRALKAHDPDGSLSAVLEESGLGNHPHIVNLFYTIGKSMVEDGMIPGEVQGVATKDLARKKIAEMQADAKHPYHSSRIGDPIHEEFTKLFEIAYED